MIRILLATIILVVVGIASLVAGGVWHLVNAQTPPTPVIDERVASLETRVSLLEGTPPAPSATPTETPAPATSTPTAIPATPTETPAPPTSTATVTPTPAGPLVLRISFEPVTKLATAPGSDNWPITWADDGQQYTAWGDGGGFGGTDSVGRVSLGVGRIDGPSPGWTGSNIAGGVGAPNLPPFTGKSHGIISIGGTLWLWRCGDGSGTDAFKFQRLYTSTDHGATWTYAGWQFDQTNGGAFFCPTFLQFGQDYAGALDGYVYAYAPEIKQGTIWDVQYPGAISLMRVPVADIHLRPAYEFYAGTDGGGAPIWTADIAARQPVFSDAVNGVMRTKVTYNPGLGRYILTTQQVSRWRTNGARLGIYEATAPWGPWRTVLLGDPWALGVMHATAEKTVSWGFSNKWTSADGLTTWLVYTDRDEFAVMRAVWRWE